MNTKSIGLLASVVFAVGFMGVSLGENVFSTSEQPSTTATAESGNLLGHIEVIHTDSDGNIKSYQQTDNVVMNTGKNCAAKLLFGINALSTASNCTLNAGSTFTTIGLSAAAIGTPATTATTLSGEYLLSGGVCAGICNRANGTATVSSSADATSDGASKTTRISKTFTLTNASATIRSAGLFNSTSTSTYSVFAERAFTSAVSMAANDQLTVNWDITLG